MESAAYFVIAEALTNTAKHARAQHSWVRLSDDHRALAVVVGDDGCGGADPLGSGLAGLRARVEALDGSLRVDSPDGGGTRAGGEAPMRVVIAEDLALLREGLVALLRENQIEVVAQVRGRPGAAARDRRPQAGPRDRRRAPASDLQRRGPAGGDRGAPRASPQLGVLVLSQYVETTYASELIGEDTAGIGYLLKERVGDVRAFLDALHTRRRRRHRARPPGRRPAARPRATARVGRCRVSPRASARCSR